MRQIPEKTLEAIERNLDEVIRGRAGWLIDQHSVPLPSLAAMVAGQASVGFGPTKRDPDVWFFPIPGMYGGFRCRWLSNGPDAKPEAVSFCRVTSGSGQRHEITADQVVLVESDAALVGLVANQLIGETQAVLKPLGKLFRQLRGVAASTIFGDGRVGLVIDVATLVRMVSDRARSAA